MHSSHSIRKFFKYAQRHKKSLCNKFSLVTDTSEFTSTDLETANAFIEHFESVYNTPIPHGRYLHTLPRISESLEDVDISVQAIHQKLLNVSKSPGPDNIHPILLKMFSHYFSVLLTILFSKSILTGRLPNYWKDAYIIPIHKKLSKQDACNFRPISITSSVIKILESIIKPQLVGHLIKHNIIHPNQHGFVPGKSKSESTRISI